jgi:hypothetical protein
MNVLCWRVLYSHWGFTTALSGRSAWPRYEFVDCVDERYFSANNYADRGFYCSLPLAIYPMIGDVPKHIWEIPI